MKITIERYNSRFWSNKAENTCATLHINPELEFVYCLDGELSVMLSGMTGTMRQGDFMIIAPNAPHSLHTPAYSCAICGIASMEYIHILAPFLSMPPEAPFVHIPTPEIEQLLLLLTDTIYFLNRDAFTDRDIILGIGYLHQIFALALPYLKFKSQRPQANDRLPEVLEYLNENFRKNLSQKEIARMIGYNPSSLSRMFSQRCGMSIWQYLNSLRVDCSLNLLKTTDMSITNIAYECGFSSQSSFNRAFLQNTGTAPREHRKPKL